MKGRRNEWVHLSSVDKVALRIVCSSSFVRDVAARHRVDGGLYRRPAACGVAAFWAVLESLFMFFVLMDRW